ESILTVDSTTDRRIDVAGSSGLDTFNVLRNRGQLYLKGYGTHDTFHIHWDPADGSALAGLGGSTDVTNYATSGQHDVIIDDQNNSDDLSTTYVIGGGFVVRYGNNLVNGQTVQHQDAVTYQNIASLTLNAGHGGGLQLGTNQIIVNGTSVNTTVNTGP